MKKIIIIERYNQEEKIEELKEVIKQALNDYSTDELVITIESQ